MIKSTRKAPDKIKFTTSSRVSPPPHLMYLKCVTVFYRECVRRDSGIQRDYFCIRTDRVGQDIHHVWTTLGWQCPLKIEHSRWDSLRWRHRSFLARQSQAWNYSESNRVDFWRLRVEVLPSSGVWSHWCQTWWLHCLLFVPADLQREAIRFVARPTRRETVEYSRGQTCWHLCGRIEWVCCH